MKKILILDTLIFINKFEIRIQPYLLLYYYLKFHSNVAKHLLCNEKFIFCCIKHLIVLYKKLIFLLHMDKFIEEYKN